MNYLTQLSQPNIGKQSYIDKTGNVPFQTDFDVLGDFNNGLACVKKDGKWGILAIEEND